MRLLVTALAALAVTAPPSGQGPRSERHDLAARLDAVRDLEADGALETIAAVRARWFALPTAADLGPWFRLFERFPEDDGNGLFWSVLHDVERVPGYEAAAAASLRRRPSRFGVLLVQRLVAGGVTHPGGTDLRALLRATATRAELLPAVRAELE